MKNILLISILSISVSFQSLSQQSEIQKNIKELLVLTGSAELGVQVAGQLLSSFNKAYPDVPQDFWDEVMKEINTDDLINLVIPIYKKYYTLEEINQLIVFYKTPLGKKMTAVLPGISSDSMAAGQKWGKEIAEKVIKKLEDR